MSFFQELPKIKIDKTSDIWAQWTTLFVSYIHWTNHFWTPCNWMILHSAWCPSHFQIKHSIQQSIKLHFDFRNGKFWFNLQNTFMSISPGHGRKTRVFPRIIKLRRKLLWVHPQNQENRSYFKGNKQAMTLRRNIIINELSWQEYKIRFFLLLDWWEMKSSWPPQIDQKEDNMWPHRMTPSLWGPTGSLPHCSSC